VTAGPGLQFDYLVPARKLPELDAQIAQYPVAVNFIESFGAEIQLLGMDRGDFLELLHESGYFHHTIGMAVIGRNGKRVFECIHGYAIITKILTL